MIYCSKCGFGLQDDADFCPECGTPAKKVETNFASGDSQTPTPPPASSVDLAQIENTAFFQFTKPLMDSIDQGKFFKKPFRWLYIIFAVLCLLLPFYLLIKFIEDKIFDFWGFSAILAWLFIAFAGWIGFQLWWNRKAKINRYVEKGDDFLATPTFSHFIQTLGEWYGITIAILGFGFSLCGLIAANKFGGYSGYGGYRGGFDDFSPSLFGFGGSEGILGLIISPIVGFFIIVFSRFIAEFIRALAAIANNTKKSKN